MKPFSTVLLATVAAGLLASPSASALEVSRQLWNQGGVACQLSVPTTSTLVRPRASGMRNEGTVNEFVICQYAATSAVFTIARMSVGSLDGANHSVQCTGVVGGADAPKYSTKTVDTGTSNYVYVAWFPADFGASNSFGNYMFSVTCILPAGAFIQSVHGEYSDYVGN